MSTFDQVLVSNSVTPIRLPVNFFFKDDVLHLVFLVDSSDSFNKLENTSLVAGNLVLEKWLIPLLQKGKIQYVFDIL